MRAACFIAFAALAALASAQSWTPQHSVATVNLRGVSAYSGKIAWASGAKGTFLRTTDGGATWEVGAVPGAADLDFRGIQAIDEDTAFLVSAGTGELSRIYKTTDAGKTWHLLQINPAPKGFWDAIAMWDPKHGIVIGDPVQGRFAIWTTTDGENWHQEKGPQAQTNEGAFAASNGSVFVRGSHEAWFGSGGVGGSRVFHSDDDGKSWTAAKTPVRNDSAEAGIFGLAFSNAQHGIAVGGDFSKPFETRANLAVTQDGGKTWASQSTIPLGYRSAVVYVPERKLWIAAGTSGSDVSTDDGKTWMQFDGVAYNAMSFIGGSGWAVGPNGALAKFTPK